MSRVAKAIEFTNSDINRLNNVVHNDLSSPESVKRCKAILLAIEGKNNKTIASDLGVRENTVSDWRKVWKNGGINALLSISHTGRPRSEARKAIEEELSKDARANDHAVLREKTGASESTVYRALAEKNSSTCTMSVAMDTMPKHVDICGLYISSSESAAILRVTDKEVALSNGEMIVYSEKTAKVIDDARSEDGHIQLTKALSALTAHASDVGAVSRKSGMQTFLASLVPALPDDNNDVYYVIYSSMNPNCTRPTLARMNMRTNCVATIDIWLSETGFWINMLSRDDEMAREFGLYTREYLAARLPDSEPFQWYRHDITPQNIIAIESNDFADPSVNSVVTITATIQNRDGTQATVESKVCNAVPAAKDIQYSDVLEFSGSLGTLDTGLGNVFRQAQCQLMESYIGEASKKKQTVMD